MGAAPDGMGDIMVIRIKVGYSSECINIEYGVNLGIRGKGNALGSEGVYSIIQNNSTFHLVSLALQTFTVGLA